MFSHAGTYPRTSTPGASRPMTFITPRTAGPPALSRFITPPAPPKKGPRSEPFGVAPAVNGDKNPLFLAQPLGFPAEERRGGHARGQVDEITGEAGAPGEQLPQAHGRPDAGRRQVASQKDEALQTRAPLLAAPGLVAVESVRAQKGTLGNGRHRFP